VDDGGNRENIRSKGKERGVQACEVAPVISAPREILDNGLHGEGKSGRRR
jgi:hypothetical protein